MKIDTLPKLNEFVNALTKCKGHVWLETQNRDKFNLMSVFSQYLALDMLLLEQKDNLSLTFMYEEDEIHFEKFCSKT